MSSFYQNVSLSNDGQQYSPKLTSNSKLLHENDLTKIKNDLERDYNQRLNHIKLAYDTRIQTFQETIRNALRAVQKDELIETMKQDSASKDFVKQRTKEIFDEYFFNDREALIEKLTHQCSHLKVDNGKLEQENIRLNSALIHLESEDEKKIRSLEDQLEYLTKSKDSLELENKNLKHKIDEMIHQYDGIITKKDNQIHEKDVLEISHYRKRANELEQCLKDKDDQYWECTNQLEIVKKDNEKHLMRIQELEIDISGLKVEIDGLKNQLKQANEALDELQVVNNQSKKKLKGINDEMTMIKESLKQSETTKNSLEDKYKSRIYELEEELKTEKETHQQHLLKINEQHKVKIKQYKQKIMEYKLKISEKEKDLQALLRKNDEEKMINEKNIEILQKRIAEMKQANEEKLISIEEEHHKKLNEGQLRHEDNLRELQIQFQNLLEQKINEIQSDSSTQIQIMKDNEKELRILIDEKITQLEKDYVRMNQLEVALQEKQALIEKLKDEIINKENNHIHELNHRSKAIEDRKNREFDNAQLAYQNNIRQLQEDLSLLKYDKKHLETELYTEKESSKKLSLSLNDSEIQLKKLLETIEDKDLKYKKLKQVYEEEYNQRIMIEGELQALKNRIEEMNKHLDEMKNEIIEKNNQVRKVSQALENRENELMMEMRKVKSMEKDLEAFRVESTMDDHQKNEIIKNLRDAFEALKKESKQNLDRYQDALRLEKQNYESEMLQHLEAKNKLKELQSNLQDSLVDMQTYQAELDKSKRKINELENANSEMRSKVSKLELIITQLQKEKNDSMKKHELVKERVHQLRLHYEKQTRSRLNDQRRELSALKDYIKNILFDQTKQCAFQITSLMNLTREVFRNKEAYFDDGKNQLKAYIESDFSKAFENLKVEYEKNQKEIIGEYEHRLQEKDRKIDSIQENFDKLNSKLYTIERERDKTAYKITQLEEDNTKLKMSLTNNIKDKEALQMKLDSLWQKYTHDIEEINNELVKIKENFYQEKVQIENQFKEELITWQEAINDLKDKHSKNIQKYENELQKLEEAHFEEIKALKHDNDDKITYYVGKIGNMENVEQDLLAKISTLQEKVGKLERQIMDLEKEKHDLNAMQEKRYQNYQSQLEQFQFTTQIELDRHQKYKNEKQLEIQKMSNAIEELHEKIKHNEEKIKQLIIDKNKLQQMIRDYQIQLEIKNNQVDKQKLEIVEKTIQQSKEIEQLQQLLSKSYKSISDNNNNTNTNSNNDFSKTFRSREKTNENDRIDDLVQSVIDLKKLSRYLDSAKSLQKSSSSSLGQENQRKTRKLSISQLKSER